MKPGICVAMSLLRGRHTLTGSVPQVIDELAAFRELGVDHVALEVSYTTCPAILETIDRVAGQVRPRI
jgi:hypothetical protein